MIPLRDHNPASTTPVITWSLLIANLAVFVYSFFMSTSAYEDFLLTYAVIPNEISNLQDLGTIFSAMFLHGGLAHILGNMLFLHIFGDNLEDRLGHIKFLLFYLLCGVAATLAQVYINPDSTIPNIGASGAIAGLMGGYLLLFPNHRVDTLVPGFGFVQTVALPAYAMLVYWIAYQFILGFGSLGFSDEGGVAYFAHIGGFIAGLLLVKIFDRGNRTAEN